MGLRMYCNICPEDNESPKFYGYVSEEEAGKSFKFLKDKIDSVEKK